MVISSLHYEISSKYQKGNFPLINYLQQLQQTGNLKTKIQFINHVKSSIFQIRVKESLS
jgi:hypothetical protein